MTGFLTFILFVAVLYCLVQYAYLAYRVYRYHEDHELVTFHLGLCLILAVGFLLLNHTQMGQVTFFRTLFADSSLR